MNETWSPSLKQPASGASLRTRSIAEMAAALSHTSLLR